MATKTQPTIIRDAAQLADASTADLLATYNAMTGESVARFATREVALRRTEMALMAATDAAAHLGVAPGAKVVPLTAAERAAKTGKKPTQEASKPIDATLAQTKSRKQRLQAPAKPEGDSDDIPFKPGTLAYSLAVATRSVEKRELPQKKPRDPKQPGAARRAPIVAVRPTFQGKSKPQEGSARTNVLRFIEKQRKNKDGHIVCSVEKLNEHFGDPSAWRGHVQKLIEVGHLESLATAE